MEASDLAKRLHSLSQFLFQLKAHLGAQTSGDLRPRFQVDNLAAH